MYRIEDINFNKGPEDTFDQRDGTKMTFAKYYSDKYGKKLEKMD